jgi:hypothetical protein
MLAVGGGGPGAIELRDLVSVGQQAHVALGPQHRRRVLAESVQRRRPAVVSGDVRRDAVLLAHPGNFGDIGGVDVVGQRVLQAAHDPKQTWCIGTPRVTGGKLLDETGQLPGDEATAERGLGWEGDVRSGALLLAELPGCRACRFAGRGRR